jgi:dTDP-4-dehydrorhamnose reductase
VRVAVTGAGGRLGRALVTALEDAPYSGPFGPLAWRRPDYDLDDPGAAARLLDRDRPEVVVHAAAWTDVDGCALDPHLAMRRNADAVAELATACAARRVDLVLVSTNEVFPGDRARDRDGVVASYAPGAAPAPANPYGRSKLAGEEAARAAFAAVGGIGAEARGGPVAPDGEPDTLPGGRVDAPQLAIVRTAWLFGAPGADFPSRMLAAADRALADGRTLRLVADEVGQPTYSPDLADAIAELLGAPVFAGTHHLTNGGAVSRADWARETFALAGIAPAIEDVPLATFERPSRPPLRAVLAPTPLPGGEPLRLRALAMADYAPALLRWRASAAAVVR